jgi:glucokinase
MTRRPPDLGTGPAVLAFDVGGTGIKAALVDGDGRVAASRTIPTPPAGADAGARVIDSVAELAWGLRDRTPGSVPVAAGLVVPGIVDAHAGVGVHSENIGWRDYPFRDRASSALGLPVAFDHDVRTAGETERRIGAARGFDDVLVVTIGTGIAAAIYLGGAPYLARGHAGEIGHLRVADGPRCTCGANGCLEAVASAAALPRCYEERTGVRVVGARDVLARVAAGDPDAFAVWNDALDGLAFAFSACVAVLAPEAIIVGGGLSGAGAALLDPVRDRLHALLTYQQPPRLLLAETGADAGLLGAALLARDLVEK